MGHRSTLPQIWAAVRVLCRVDTAVHAWWLLIRNEGRIRGAEPMADRATYHRWELAQGRQPNVMFLLKAEAHESQGAKDREGE